MSETSDTRSEDEAAGGDGVRRKHRHDRGEEDHGAKLAAGTTRAIQVMLGLWLAGTAGLIVYALLGVGRVSASTDQPRLPAASAPQAR
jgi:hypothetical protein